MKKIVRFFEALGDLETVLDSLRGLGMDKDAQELQSYQARLLGDALLRGDDYLLGKVLNSKEGDPKSEVSRWSTSNQSHIKAMPPVKRETSAGVVWCSVLRCQHSQSGNLLMVVGKNPSQRPRHALVNGNKVNFE